MPTLCSIVKLKMKILHICVSIFEEHIAAINSAKNSFFPLECSEKKSGILRSTIYKHL